MNPECHFSCIKILIIFGFTLIALSFTLGIVTFVIPHWHNITASTTEPSRWTSYPRTSGIFQECLTTPPSDISIITPITPPFTIRYGCVDIDYGQYKNVISSYLSNDTGNYTMIRNMRQSHIGMHSVTLLLLLFVLIMGIGIFIRWCHGSIDSVFYIKWRYSLGFFSILSFLCFATSSSIGTALNVLYNNSHTTLNFLPYSPNTTNVVSFGYMFYLSWTGSGIALLASILFFVSAHIGKNLELKKYKPHVMSIDNPAFATNEHKYPEPIFLEPSISSKPDFNSVQRSTNTRNTPGLLPRYDLSVSGNL